jgi:hypothetical protein
LQAPEEYNSTYRNHEELHDAMLDFGATVGSYLGSDYNQTRLKMDDIYTFEKNLSEVFNITIKKGASRFHVQTCHILTGGPV